MEENIFPSSAVAEVLERHYVESRLHTDGERNIDRILELQTELTGSVATPFYVLIDPSTGKSRGVFDRATPNANEFLEFLNKPL